MRSTFNIIFYPKRSETNRSGKSAIMVKITVNGKRIAFSTKLQIECDRWDSASQRVRGRSAEDINTNKILSSIYVRIEELYHKQLEEHGYADLQRIKNTITGGEQISRTILDFIRAHNELYAKKVDVNTSQKTYSRYLLLEKRMEEFMKSEFRQPDMSIREVNPVFLEKLYLFLRIKYNVENNYAMKFIQRFRRVFQFALDSGLQIPNPFGSFKIKFEETERVILTQEEIDRVWSKKFTVKRLEEVRDMFIFGCYTGISFSDMMKLNESNINTAFDNFDWIMDRRQKTKSSFNIRLFDIPRAILEKYRGTQPNGRIFPAKSNQKVNAYLEEVLTLCGIDKKATFHSSRHSFATSIALSNGVPIESVAKMLGHKNIRTTQIYAKITDHKLSADMENLAQKLNNR